MLLRTLVDVNPDVVGGALDLLQQDLDLIALAAESADDTDAIGYAVLRASRRVAAISELRRRIGEGRLSVDSVTATPTAPTPRRTVKR